MCTLYTLLHSAGWEMAGPRMPIHTVLVHRAPLSIRIATFGWVFPSPIVDRRPTTEFVTPWPRDESVQFPRSARTAGCSCASRDRADHLIKPSQQKRIST